MDNKSIWAERLTGLKRGQIALLALMGLCALLFSGITFGEGPALLTASVCPDPTSLAIGMGETGMVAIAVTNAEDLYSMQVTIGFDPDVLEIVDDDPARSGVQVALGTVFSEVGWTVSTNLVCTDTGTIELIASRTNADNWFDGDGTLVEATLYGLAPGVSPFSVDEVIFSDRFGVSLDVVPCSGSEVVVGDPPTPTMTPVASHTPTLTPTPTVTRTPLPGPIIPVVVKIEPDHRQIAVGMTTTVDIDILGAMNLYGAEVHIAYDSTVVHVVDMDPGTPGVQVTLGDMPYPDYVASNVADNIAGSLSLAVNQLEPRLPAMGDGTMGTITFHAVGPGLSAVTISSTLLSDPDAYAIPSVTYDGEIEVLGGGMMVGQVTFQGRPAPPDITWICPLSVTLAMPGTGVPVHTFATMADAYGTFTVPLILTDTFDVRVRDLHSLWNMRGDVSVYWGMPTVDMGELPEGDCNGDNHVNVSDLVILTNAYDATLGDPDFDLRADLNNDGQINVSDLVLLTTNYDLSGDHVLTLMGGRSLSRWVTFTRADKLPPPEDKQRAPPSLF